MKEFEEIYSQYYDIVFRYTLYLCQDEEWAQDITQEAFFKALRNIDKFRGECKLNVWLCQIAKNIFFTELKRKNKRILYPLEILPSKADFEQKIYNQDAAFELHQLLHKLENPYKEVFWMRTFGELSFAKIAILWDKSENWARVTYYRAKLKIKSQMNKGEK